MLARLDLPNGAKTEQSYDSLHRLTQVQNLGAGNANLASYAYGYDTRDVRTGVTSQMGEDPLKQIAYAYDAVDQLTGESATGGAANSAYSNAFQYDAMGNRTRAENVTGGNTTLTRTTPNELNQLTALSTSQNGGEAQNSGLSYDASGNLTQVTGADGSKTLYTYDDADRLTRIENRDAANAPTSKSEFVYDFASRKVVSREFSYTAGAWVKTGEVRRVFDGLDVIQERNAANEVTAQYTRDGNIGGILARTSQSGQSYFHYDGGGNVTALSDETGNLVGRYSYDAFGNTLEASGERAAENPYRFSTKEWHAASGMVDFGYRFYSPGLGRWLNRDPIQEDGGINLYGFVANNPVNSVDSYGLRDVEETYVPALVTRNFWAAYHHREGMTVRRDLRIPNPSPWTRGGRTFTGGGYTFHGPVAVNGIISRVMNKDRNCGDVYRNHGKGGTFDYRHLSSDLYWLDGGWHSGGAMGNYALGFGAQWVGGNIAVSVGHAFGSIYEGGEHIANILMGHVVTRADRWNERSWLMIAADSPTDAYFISLGAARARPNNGRGGYAGNRWRRR